MRATNKRKINCTINMYNKYGVGAFCSLMSSPIGISISIELYTYAYCCCCSCIFIPFYAHSESRLWVVVCEYVNLSSAAQISELICSIKVIHLTLTLTSPNSLKIWLLKLYNYNCERQSRAEENNHKIIVFNLSAFHTQRIFPQRAFFSWLRLICN